MTKTLIHTALSPEQCRDRLAAAMDNDGASSFFGAFGSNRVMGRADEAGFRLQMRIGYRNSFKTFMWGKFIGDGYGTTVELRSGMLPSVVIFMSIWMTGAVLGSLGAGAAAIGTLFTKGIGTALPLLAFSIGFPLFGVGLVTFGRWLARDEEAELAQFVIDHLKAS